MKTSPQAAQRVAQTYPLTRLRSCAVGVSGGPVLQAWLRPRGLAIGAGGAYPACITPRTLHRKGCAPLGGQANRAGGRAIGFFNREGGASAIKGLTRGNWGVWEGVTGVVVRRTARFATLRNPRVCLVFPRVGVFFPRVGFCNVSPFSFFSLHYIEREEGEEGGADLQNAIPGLAQKVPGFEKLVTGPIPGLHGASPGFTGISGDGIPLQINGLRVVGGRSPHPREEMPPSPPRGLFFGVVADGC